MVTLVLDMVIVVIVVIVGIMVIVVIRNYTPTPFAPLARQVVLMQ
jgi:hypothetical protein